MNRLQRLATGMFGPGVERESRQWLVECGHCGHTDSVWDLGGIRYKASGTKRLPGRRGGCGHPSMRVVYRLP